MSKEESDILIKYLIKTGVGVWYVLIALYGVRKLYDILLGKQIKSCLVKVAFKKVLNVYFFDIYKVPNFSK